MNRFYIFYACLAIYGTVFGFSAVSTITGGSLNLPMILAGIAGVGMVAASLYEVLTGSPSDFNIGNIAFWAVVSGTVGILLLQVSEYL